MYSSTSSIGANRKYDICEKSTIKEKAMKKILTIVILPKNSNTKPINVDNTINTYNKTLSLFFLINLVSLIKIKLIQADNMYIIIVGILFIINMDIC